MRASERAEIARIYRALCMVRASKLEDENVNSLGLTGVGSAGVTPAPTPPTIVDFTADPTELVDGDSTQFTYQTTGVVDTWVLEKSIASSGVWQTISGDVDPLVEFDLPVGFALSYDIRLTVSGPGGSAGPLEKDNYITVSPP